MLRYIISCLVFTFFLSLSSSVSAAPFYFEAKNYGLISMTQETQIKKVFEKIDSKYTQKTAEEKEIYLKKLEEQIITLGKSLQTKNTLKYEKYAPLLNALLSQIYSRTQTEEIETQETNLGVEENWESFTFHPKTFATASGSLGTDLGEFRISDDITVDSLEITLSSDSKINLGGQKKYLRIQRVDGTVLNIALSSSLEYESDTQMVVKFSSPIFMRAGTYRFNGVFENTGNSFYDTYIDSVKIGKREFAPGKGKYKLGETSIESPKIFSFKEIGLIQKPYEVEEIGTFLGAFEVFGDDFFFENLRLKVTSDTALELSNEQMYLLDASGDIFATSSGFQEENGMVYVSFRNVVLRPGIYQLGLTEMLGNQEVTEVRSFIDQYTLSTLKESLKKNYLFGFPLTDIRIK